MALIPNLPRTGPTSDAQRAPNAPLTTSTPRSNHDAWGDLQRRASPQGATVPRPRDRGTATRRRGELEGVVAALAGPHADRRLDIDHPDLAVTDLSGGR